MRAQKSNVFLSETKFFYLGQKVVDKQKRICLNDFIIWTNMDKDVDGKSAILDFLTESRRLVRAGGRKMDSLIPELVL